MNERHGCGGRGQRKTVAGTVAGLVVAFWAAIMPAALAQETTPAQPLPTADPPRAEVEPAPAAMAPAPTGEQIESPQIQQIASPQVANLWLDAEAYPVIERAINVMNAHTTRAHALNFVVDHRTFQAFQTHPFNDWVGFDVGGLKIGLTLRYGILEDLEVGVQRVSNGVDTFDTYQFDAKYWAVHADRFFVDMAVRAGGTWYSAPQGPDSGGAFGQLIVSRSLGQRLWLSSGLTYHSNATNELRPGLGQERRGGQAYALAVPVALEVRLLTYLAWDAEATFNVAGYHSKYPVAATALKLISYRHTFALLMSNSPYVTVDGLVANTSNGIHHLIVGFTITREFDL